MDLPTEPPFARVFVALWPGPAVRTAIAASRDRWRWPAEARLVPDERLHVTLHFIGAVPRSRLPALTHALAVPMRRFDLHGGAPEVWPHGIAVQRVEGAPPALLDLHRTLGEAITSLGFPLEARPYAPHVTLARHAPGATLPPRPERWRWSVAGYRLVESLPGGEGYRSLARYPASSPSERASEPKAER